MAYDVFISHSHKDKKIADAVCHHFEVDNIKCWIAPRDIVPGSNWAHSIAEAIPKCKILLLIFSNHSNISDQVLREVELAVKNKLIVVPVKIEDILPSGGMEYYLSTVHWIDAVNKRTEKYIKELVETIKRYLDIEGKATIPKIGAEPSKKKKTPLAVWIAAIAVVTALIVLAVIFADKIFSDNDASLKESPEVSQTTTEITQAPTQKPTSEATPSPTAEPTATPTPKIDPNAPLNTVVEIPDITLRACVLKTLDDMGHHVDGQITLEDMYKLKELVIISRAEEKEMATSSLYTGHNYVVTDTGFESLEGLQYAKNLEILLIARQGLEDISALSQIYNLKEVQLRLNNIKDISGLVNSGQLEFLNLCRNRVSDLRPLIALYDLKQVDISGNPVSDLTPLSGLVSLKTLEMDTMTLTSLEAISELTNLEMITVGGNSIKSFEPLKNLDNLTTVFAYDCNLESIISLKNIKNLKELALPGNSNITDFDSLLELTNLKALYVDNYQMNKYSDIIQQLKNRGCKVTLFG